MIKSVRKVYNKINKFKEHETHIHSYEEEEAYRLANKKREVVKERVKLMLANQKQVDDMD